MERQFKILKWDGFHFGAVLTHWPQENTNAGTVWRFVMDRGQTLIAVPYQTPDKSAPANYCIPERIESIRAAGRFGWAVRYAAGVNVNLDECWGQKVNEATGNEFSAWKAKQDFPTLTKHDKARLKAQRERDAAWEKAGLAQEDDNEWAEANPGKKWDKEREKISSPLFAPLDVIKESDEYKAEKSRHDNKQNEILAAHKKRVEEEKATREKELIAEALEELRDMLAWYGIKRFSEEKCKMLFDFIRQDVCGGRIMNPAIGNAGFERVVEKVEELTGKDITKSVLMDCEPWRLARESGAEGLERARWVALFPNGRQTLIEELTPCIHNGRDADLFEKVKPSKEERKIIERVIVEERQSVTEREFGKDSPMSREDAAQYLGVSVSTIDRWSKDNLITAHKIGRSVRFYRNELDEDVHKNRLKQ